MNRRSFVTSMGAASAAPFLSAADPTTGRKPRLLPALCCYSFRDQLKDKSMTYEDLVLKAVDWGINGLDTTVYWFPNISPSWLLPLRRHAYQNGVEIYSISVRTELTQPKENDREAQVALIRQWVDVADTLGASHIRIFGGAVPKGSTEDQAQGWVTECLKKASEYAGNKGIILGLENHGGITARAERIVSIVKAVDSPWVRVNVDTGNFNSEVFPQLEMLLPYAANIQVKVEMAGDDGKKVKQDWDKIAGLIARSGYRGYLALEYEAKEPAPEAVPGLLRKLDAVCRKHSYWPAG